MAKLLNQEHWEPLRPFNTAHLVKTIMENCMLACEVQDRCKNQ
jgi:hypothetical protein